MTARTTASSRPVDVGADVRTAARGGVLALGGAVASALGGFGLAVAVGRGLGARQAGFFYLAIAVFSVLLVMCTLGADTGLMRHVSRARALRQQAELGTLITVAVLPVTAAAVGLTIAALALAPTIASWLSDPGDSAELTRFLRAALVSLPLGALALVGAQASRGFGGVITYVATQNLLVAVGRPVLAIAVVWLSLDAVAVPFTWGAVLAPAMIVSLLVVHHQLALERRVPGSPPPRRASHIASEFWSFASLRGASAIAEALLLWAQVLLVGALGSADDAGVYGSAARLVLVGTLVLQAMRLAIAPTLSQLLSTGQLTRAATVYRTATTWILAASWPAYITLAIFSAFAVQVFGDEFRGGADAVAILSIGMLVSLATGNVGTVLLMSGHSGWLLLNKCAALFTCVGLSLVLIPAFGIEGAAIAWVCATAVDNLSSALQVRRWIGLRAYDRTSAAVAGACALFGAAGVVLVSALGATWWTLVLYALVAGIPYLALLWRMRFQLAPGRQYLGNHAARSSTARGPR